MADQALPDPSSRVAIWLVLLAAAATFGLTAGTRQAMGLFLGPMNTATGLGLANISLAFAFGQLFWGLTQPFAGVVADRIGAAPTGSCDWVWYVDIVLALGAALVHLPIREPPPTDAVQA